QRNHVIHRQELGADALPAIMALAVGNPPLPPAASAELPRSRLLAAQLRIGDVGDEAIAFAHTPSSAAVSWSDSSSHSFISQATCSSVSLRDRVISWTRRASR